MNVETFFGHTPNEFHRFLLRPGWIVRLGEIGRLAGAGPFTVVGVIRDHDTESGRVTYGLIGPGNMARVESKIDEPRNAPLARAMEQALVLETWTHIAPGPERLADLRRLHVSTTRSVQPPTWHTGYKNMHSENDYGPAAFEILERQRRREEDFERRRMAAIALQLPRWNIETHMKHRGDFGWVGEAPWVCELIREHSRRWLELPNAPVDAPIPLPAIGEFRPVEPPAERERGRTILDRMREALS